MHWSVMLLTVLATLSIFQLEGRLFSIGINESLTFSARSPQVVPIVFVENDTLSNIDHDPAKKLVFL